MRRREFIITVAFLVSENLFAQEKEKVTGIWELDVDSKRHSGSSRIVAMKQVGKSVKVRDLETGKDYTGIVTDRGIKFPLTVKGGASEALIKGSFDGTIKQGVMKGQTELDGSTYEWVAVRLTSVWLCANHNPKHTAKSKEDMVNLTQQSKCEGWHRARPDDLGS